MRFNRLLFIGIMFCLVFTSLSFASTGEKQDNSVSTIVTIVNNQTGDVVYTDKQTNKVVYDEEMSAEATGVFDYVIDVSDELSAGSKDSTSGQNTSSSYQIKAYGTINYVRSGEMIKVTSFSGGWTPLQSYVTISNREVWGYDGVLAGNYIEKYPNSNSFSYSTGWGFVYFYPGTSVSGTRLFTSADAHITGMTGSYTITLLVALS